MSTHEMRPMIASWRWTAAFVAMLVLVAVGTRHAAARQEPISVHATAVPQSAYVGDQIELQVIVRGSRNVPQPVVPVTPDYTVGYAGPSDASSIQATLVNGQFIQKTSIIYTHRFAITAKHAGEITIPGFDVVVEGKTYTTKPVTISIREPSQTGDFTFEVTPDKQRIYEGEPVRLHFVWKFGKQPRGASFQIPPLPPGVELLPAPDPRPPGTPPQDPRYEQFMLGSEPVVASIATMNEEGRRIGMLSFDRILMVRDPLPSGRLQWGSARIDFNAIVGQRAPRFTDGPFPDLDVLERHVCVSKPFEFEVLPLPEAGRPADFSGLVGSYTVTASADPRDVAVGEPMTLRVTVNGPPPLSLVPVLDLTQQPTLASGFRVPRDPSLPTFTPVGAMFTYPIRARSVESTQIPPIEINYFDTTAGAYRVARSEPIRITVRPSTSADAGLDEPDSAAEIRTAAAKPSSRVDTGRLDLSGRRFDLMLAAARPATFAIVAGPPVAFAALWMALAARRRAMADPAGRRRRRAVRAARGRLRRAAAISDRAAAAAAVSSTLTDLAADWFDRPAGSLTSPQALQLLSDEAGDPGEAGQLAGLLAECDRIRFSGAPAADAAGSGTLISRTRETLEAIAESLRRRQCA